MKILLVWAFLTISYRLPQAGECASTHDPVLPATPSTREQLDTLRDIARLKEQNELASLLPGSPQFYQVKDVILRVFFGNASEEDEDLLQSSTANQEEFNRTKELIEAQKSSATSVNISSFYERYHPLEEIYEWINLTAQTYPDRVETILIGKSFEQRPLYVLKLTGDKKADKKAIWIDCGIHAREWISPAFCIWFVHHSLINYKQDGNITDILDNMDVYVLPVMNPDGYKFTWLPMHLPWNRMWRKNRSYSEDRLCVGVDLNRNFDANWCTEGALNNTCSQIYCGSSPHSEPETQAVTDFLRSRNGSVQIYYTIHSYSQLLLFPYAHTLEKPPTHDELNELVKEAAERIKTFSGNTYEYGASATRTYVASGGSTDWAFNQGIKYVFSFELQDQGDYGFLLPPSLISQACQEALIAVETISLRVIEKSNRDSQ
ncbi:carboxypeptidase B2 [Myripristis murdjan]|uniref:Carboxypeptidase B2 (plasma) n=1 Tax=Myripristis murdjan TaxID=586833 RepID=A0A668AGA4_9TELE|nr:carboxypeptidase O [Myripristis murdjan]XP_029928227.1 carboxypeptidase O [Myripristis murdjan]